MPKQTTPTQKAIIAREKHKAQQRQWAKANPDNVKASQRAWAKANPEKTAAKSRRWREAHPQAAREATRKWYYKQRLKQQRVQKCLGKVKASLLKATATLITQMQRHQQRSK